MKYFEQQFSFFKGKGLGNDCSSILRVSQTEIRLTEDAIFFGNYIADDNFLYIRNSRKGLLGFRLINHSEGEIIFNKVFSAHDIFAIAELLIRFLVLKKGVAFLHSSSFILGGNTFILPAWGGTGKTNSLLWMLSKGAKFMADDLSLVSNNGTVFPYPRPMNLLHYNLYMNQEILRSHISLKTYLVLKIIKLFDRLTELKPTLMMTRITKRFLQLLKDRTYLYLRPSSVFGEECNPEYQEYANPKVVHISRTNRGKITVESITPNELSSKMKACHRVERLAFGDVFSAYQFAFPNSAIMIENFYYREFEIIDKFLLTIPNIIKTSLPNIDDYDAFENIFTGNKNE